MVAPRFSLLAPRFSLLAPLFVLVATSVVAQEARIASDFEIATAQRQLARERDPLLKMAAHLNLGDLHLSRQESAVAQTHYRDARNLAENERLDSRRHSDLNAYAIASAYLGLSEAKLGRAAASFDAFEEAIRYASDSAKLWNLYASGMNLLGYSHKAAAAAIHAVDIATRAAGDDPSASELLDIAIYKYALASALISSGGTTEAEPVLRQIISSLESPAFTPLRERIEEQEKFEVFSTTRSEADSYLALMNRARLRLARIYEDGGATAEAMAQLEEILKLRTDDPIALTAMARLSARIEDRERYFAESFDANPFSIELIREYERHVTANRPATPEGDATPRRMQRAVHGLATHRHNQADKELRELRRRFPENDAVRFLDARLREARTAWTVPAYLLSDSATTIPLNETQLQQLVSAIRSDQLPPDARARLDRLTFSATARFDRPLAATEQTTTFQTGFIGSVGFRFQQPAEFRGTFAAASLLRLEFRVLGVTEREGDATLIIEPVRISLT